MLDKNSPIGVFDSGIGGLSVLRDLCAALPREALVYFADTAYAPYGEKGDAFVRQRSLAITQHLRSEHGIKALVVACNTATAAAINDCRAQHPDLIIVGIEPALKPAARQSANKHVTVFATQGTLASAKFQQLLALQSEFTQLNCIACDGLAETIERHSEELNHPDIRALVQQYVQQSRSQNTGLNADTVVLGCTHYPLVKALFTAQLPPQTLIIDNGGAVAKRLQARLAEHGLLKDGPAHPIGQSVVFKSSADTHALNALWARLN